MTENILQPDSPETKTQNMTEPGSKAAADAKKYRHKLREAEAALEVALAKIDAMQTAEVERLAAEIGLAKPATIWLSGMTLETVRDKEGNIDKNAAQEQIRAAQDSLGLRNNSPAPPNPAQTAEPIGNSPHDKWESSFVTQ